MKNALAPSNHTQLKTQIESDLERFWTAWSSNDGARLGNFFVVEGSLINPFGQRADGRSAVAGMYSEYFQGVLRGTSTRFQLASVRPLADEHAFVDGEQIIEGADGKLVLAVHLTALLRREAEGWRFVDARPYTVPAMPG